LARVLDRAIGRLITGPVAFAAAGTTDLVIYALRSLLARVKQAR
jgi:hypothetical protein